MYDKEREDGVFVPQDPTAPNTNQNTHSEGGSTSSTNSADANSRNEWNPLDTLFVTMPKWHPTTAANKVDKDKTTKNPVSHWRVARRSVVGT